MKRNLMMVLAGLLVLVMASPLYAQPDIKVNGQIRTRLRYWVNLSLSDDKDVAGSDRRYFDNRTRLGVDAKLADGVRAVIQLEKYFDFGNVGRAGVTSAQRSQTPADATGAVPTNTQTSGGGPLATLGETSADPYIRQAWMDFAVPGLQEEGIRFQAGRSFYRVGHGFIWGNSLTGEDGFTLYGPLGPGDFKVRYAMPGGNQERQDGGRARFFDNEVNMMSVDYKFDVAEKQNVELYWVGQWDKAVDVFASTVQNSSGQTVDHANDYWIGVAYTGVAGPVALKGEGVYQFGQARRNACLTALGGPASSGAACVTPNQDIDRSAYFLYGEATYKVIPAWDVGLAFTFATGDSNNSDDDFNNFVGPASEWTTSPTRVWTDSEFFYGNRSARNIGSSTLNRLYNFWGHGTEDVDSAASLDDAGNAFSPGMYELQFKTKYAFNKQVTGLLNVDALWAHHSPGTVSSYLGTEVDLKVAYKPYQNIVLNGYFGYFFEGGFFSDARNFSTTGGCAPTCEDTSSAWVFRTEAIVTF